MSSIPTPVSKSRLPAPKTMSAASGISGASKRPRAASTDQDEPILAKKNRADSTMGPPTAGNLSKAKSMYNINKAVPSSSTTRVMTSAVSKVSRPLPKALMTGRATTGMAKRPLTTSSSSTRSAMNDRTNFTPADVADGANKAKKRAAWDVKGRLEDMEMLFASTNNRVAFLESQNTALQSNVQEKETVVALNSQELNNLNLEKVALSKQVEALKKEVSEVTAESEADKKRLQRENEDLTFNKSSLERKVKSLEDELDSKQAEVAGLKMSVAHLTSNQVGIETELKQTKKSLSAAQGQVADLNKLNSEKDAKIQEYEENARAYETERRKLHNTIQELKGNIRVFCRIRPLLPGEDTGEGVIKHIDFVDERSLALVRSVDSPNESVAGGVKNRSGKYEFEFDKVFRPTCGQSQVFEEISQLVQSAIDGYNVCVFAYGQTGSGKTFTMEGGEAEGQEGMIPLTIAKIFEETERLAEKGWSYTMKASFLEIYNEDIRDLLATAKNLKYEIKMTAKGEVVTNLHVEEVTSANQIEKLLHRARKNRAVAATNCNERSSRSHSVFQLEISGHNKLTSENCTGKLNLVDLAGSERLKDSGSEGARLTETKSINKSLANLGNVILALAQKDAHIPYRNSKLTHLLQGSLGGNSKTLMFVNVSPREEYFSETLNSLRFATKVNQCQIGTASKIVK